MRNKASKGSRRKAVTGGEPQDGVGMGGGVGLGREGHSVSLLLTELSFIAGFSRASCS